jgi:hypothetical protein
MLFVSGSKLQGLLRGPGSEHDTASGICGKQIDTVTGFVPSIWILPSQ